MTTVPLETSPTYLAEITVWDPSLAATRVLRYSSKRGFTTTPSETPASTCYDPRIAQPVDVTRNLFTGGNTSGASIVGLGDLVLLNPDGVLDDLLQYGFDGQSLVVRVTTKLTPAYPSDFTTVFSGTMQSAEFDDQNVTIKVRDLMAALELPFQTSKYGGTNVLPAGLDGVASDLKGKVKPVLLGKVGDGTGTGNFSPPCVNTSKLIYQISDGAIASLDAVYDRGDALNPSGAPQWVAGSSPIAAGSGAFVVKHGGGKFLVVSQVGNLYTSPDGVTWTSRLTGIGTFGTQAVAWNGSSWLLLGSSNTYTSPDGVTWTSHAAFASVGFVISLEWSSVNSLWVAVGQSGHIYTSPDGLAWTSRTSGTSVDLLKVLEGNGLMVVAGTLGNVFSSIDCLTWTARGVNLSNDQLYDMTFSGDTFCAVGTIAATSPDGITWQRVEVPWAALGSTAVTYGDGRFFAAAGPDGYWSFDGQTWTTAVRPSVGGYAIQCAASDGTTLVMFDQNGQVAYTTLVPYANITDLQNDALQPAPGGYIVCASAGYFRLGSTPKGTITCDATQGANAAARTAAQLYNTVVIRGIPAASVNATDLTTLDSANSAVLGIYIDSDTTFVDVIDQIANTVGAGWWPSASGQWRIKRIVAATGNPLLSLGKNDIKGQLTVVNTNDAGGGLPAYRCTVNWGKNYTVQTTDLATGVTDARRAIVAQEWRAAVSTDLTVQAAHPLSPDLSKDSLFTTAADALTEATRWQALMGVQRYRYLVKAKMTSETLPLDLADELELVNPRFALQATGGDSGAQFIILDIQPNARDEEIAYTAWGAGQASRNIDTDDGLDWVTDDGVYVVTKTEN